MLIAFRPNSSFPILPIANFKTPILKIKHLLSLNYYIQSSNSSRSVPFWFIVVFRNRQPGGNASLQSGREDDGFDRYGNRPALVEVIARTMLHGH
jgi:hypothetical protein